MLLTADETSRTFSGRVSDALVSQKWASFCGHRFVFAQVNAVRVVWLRDRFVFFMLKLVWPLRHSPSRPFDLRGDGSVRLKGNLALSYNLGGAACCE